MLIQIHGLIEFIDKSIVEVFANDRQAIGRVVYPTLGGKGISVFSEGGNIEAQSVKAWELSPSNPYWKTRARQWNE